jgi:succinate-semialdehyde dehydrogenase/glutarate-semialdehyde dehydrogenase
MPLKSINPATGELLEVFEELSSAQVEIALQKAWQAFASWRQSAFARRGALLLRTAQILAEEKSDLAS